MDITHRWISYRCLSRIHRCPKRVNHIVELTLIVQWSSYRHICPMALTSDVQSVKSYHRLFGEMYIDIFLQSLLNIRCGKSGITPTSSSLFSGIHIDIFIQWISLQQQIPVEFISTCLSNKIPVDIRCPKSETHIDLIAQWNLYQSFVFPNPRSGIPIDRLWTPGNGKIISEKWNSYRPFAWKRKSFPRNTDRSCLTIPGGMVASCVPSIHVVRE